MPFGCSQSFGAICWTEAVWANQSWSAQNPPWVPGTKISKLVSCWNKIGRGSTANLQFPVHLLKLPLPISSEFYKTPPLDSLGQVSSQCRPAFPASSIQHRVQDRVKAARCASFGFVTSEWHGDQSGPMLGLICMCHMHACLYSVADQTQGLMHTRQALYQLSRVNSPVSSSYDSMG